MLRIICTFAVLAALIAGPRATAAVFTVTSTSDLADVAPGDGVCDGNPTAAVVCTLRAAVQEANALAGDDAISLPAGTYALTLAGLEDDAAAGDLDVTSGITIEGDGAAVTGIDQTTADRVFEVWQTGDLVLVDVTVSGGDPGTGLGSLGGGIRNAGLLALDGVRITGNTARLGGGVFNYGGMQAIDTLIAGNTATERIGGIASASFSASGNAATILDLISSTVGPNESFGDPTELELANGNRATLTNVTVSPGDIERYSVDPSNEDVTFDHVTVRGGLRSYSFDGSHALTFSNSAIEWCNLSGSMLPVISRLGVNASRDATCGFAAAGGVEAPLLLGEVADNGGPTPTFLPQPGSPLIDAASTPVCRPADQRGAARPQDGDGVGGAACDIGAVEAPEPGAIGAAIAAIGALARLRRRG